MYERPNNEHLTGIVLLRPRNPPRHHERRHHHHSRHHWVLICFTKVKSIIYPVSWNYHLLADVRSSLRYHAPLLVRWPNLTFPLGPQCNARHSSHSGLLLQYQCTPTVCVHRYQISNLFGSLGYFFSYVFLPCCCNFLIVWLTGQWTPCLVRVDTWVGSSDSIHRQQPSLAHQLPILNLFPWFDIYNGLWTFYHRWWINCSILYITSKNPPITCHNIPCRSCMLIRNFPDSVMSPVQIGSTNKRANELVHKERVCMNTGKVGACPTPTIYGSWFWYSLPPMAVIRES